MENEKNIEFEAETQKVEPASIYDDLFKEHTLKLNIGAVTKSGKFTIFDNLKKYKFNSTPVKYSDYKYLIYEYNDQDNKPSDKDLDDYRSLVTQPYNIYSSKVSGNLALIAELCQFNDFDLSIKNLTEELTEKDDDNVNTYKIYNPTFNFGYEGDYEHIPYGAECHFEMTWENEYDESLIYQYYSVLNLATCAVDEAKNNLSDKSTEEEKEKVEEMKKTLEENTLEDPESVTEEELNEKIKNLRTLAPENKLEFDYSYKIDGHYGNKTYPDDESGYSNEEKNSHNLQRYNQLITNKGLQYQFDVDGVLSEKEEDDDTEKNNDIWEKLIDWAKQGYFEKDNRNTGAKIRYEVTPSMNWGKVEYLKITGEIDLDKIGTGYINLSTWKYYNSDTLCTLVWGLDIYEETGFVVDSVEMDLLRIKSVGDSVDEYGFINDVDCEILHYDVGTRESWFGTFTENIPLDLNYTKIRTGEKTTGLLKSNQLYLARICVYYIPTKDVEEHEGREPELRVFYRFLYTCGIFNKYYQTTRDYVKLQPNFDLKLESKINLGISDNFSQLTREGILRTTDLSDEAKSKESSFSTIQNRYEIIIDGVIEASLEKDYNGMFYVDMSIDSNQQKDDYIFTLSKDEEDISVESSYDQQINTDEKEAEYLATDTLNLGMDNNNEFDNYVIKYRGQYGSDEDMFFWYGVDGTKILKPTSILKCFETSINNGKLQIADNKISFHIGYNLLNTVKGYATKKEGSIAGYSCFYPIAYNKYTFSKYGLEISDNNDFAEKYELLIKDHNQDSYTLFTDVPKKEIWIPEHLCLFGFTNADCGAFSEDIGKQYIKIISTDEKFTTSVSSGTIHNKHFKDWTKYYNNEGHNDYSWHWQMPVNPIYGDNPYSSSYYANFYIYYYGIYVDRALRRASIADSISYMIHISGNLLSRLMSEAFYKAKNTDDNLSRYVILLLLLGENGDVCMLPINMIDQRFTRYDSSYGFFEYPGMSMRYGFSHIFAQILNNIWVYSNRENITLQAYIVNDYFWNNTYVFNLKDNVVLTYNVDDIDNRAFYLILDDGKILLSDFIATLYSSDYKDFLIAGNNNVKINPLNITKRLNSDGETAVPFEIKIDESDACDAMRKLLKNATEFLNGIILGYDGTTIVGYSDYQASEGELLELTSDYKIQPITYFNPSKLEYSDAGVCCGPALTIFGKNILLDQTIGTLDDNNDIISGEQILNNFTYKEGRFCVKDGYTTGTGDYGDGILQLNLAIRGNNGDETKYMTGFVDAPLLPSLRMF